MASVHRATRVPAVKADPEDPAWAGVETLRLHPARNSHPLRNQTDVQMVWDENFLYIRFRSEVDSLYVPHHGGRNLPLHEGDVVEIFLDPVGDGLQWYEMQFNPVGDVHGLLTILTAEPRSDADGILSSDVFPDEVWTFSADFVDHLRHATRLLPNAENPSLWITDVALPAEPFLKRLHLKRWRPGEYRVHLVRYSYKRKGAPLEHHTWNPGMIAGNPHRSPNRMGILRLEE